MSDCGSWEDLVAGLFDLATRFGAEIYPHHDSVTLSARGPVAGDRVGSVRVSRFDDESARVETGWCFAIVVDYVFDDETRPAPALEVVEAICAGRAAESCLLDAEGEWIGVQCEAWTGAGSRWASGSSVSAARRVTRQLPGWIAPS